MHGERDLLAALLSVCIQCGHTVHHLLGRCTEICATCVMQKAPYQTVVVTATAQARSRARLLSLRVTARLTQARAVCDDSRKAVKYCNAPADFMLVIRSKGCNTTRNYLSQSELSLRAGKRKYYYYYSGEQSILLQSLRRWLSCLL